MRITSSFPPGKKAGASLLSALHATGPQPGRCRKGERVTPVRSVKHVKGGGGQGCERCVQVAIARGVRHVLRGVTEVGRKPELCGE